MSLQSFPRFLELPKKLQIQIWKEAIPKTDFELEMRKCTNYTMHEDQGYPLLQGPYSLKRIYYGACGRWAWPADSWRNFFWIMNSCRFFRLLSLKYWHQLLRDETWIPVSCPASGVDYWERIKREALNVLEELIERFAMRSALMS